MHVAVVGAGIAGLVAARELIRRGHHVQVFDDRPRPGGNAQGVPVGGVSVDLGTVYFTAARYPRLVALLAERGIDHHPVYGDFAVVVDDAVELYLPEALRAWPGRARLGSRPVRLIYDLLRFRRGLERGRRAGVLGGPLADYLAAGGYGASFQLLVSSLLSSVQVGPLENTASLDARLALEACELFGFLRLTDDPTTCLRRPAGGFGGLVAGLAAELGDRLHVGVPVRRVERPGAGVRVSTATADLTCDAVVLAIRPDQALRLLDAPSAREAEQLGRFTSERSRCRLHTHPEVPPVRGRPATYTAWRDSRTGHHAHTTVANRLSPGLGEPTRFVRVEPADGPLHALPDDAVVADEVLGMARMQWASRHVDTACLQRPDCVFAGAWRYVGSFDDGIRSGLEAAEHLDAARSA